MNLNLGLHLGGNGSGVGLVPLYYVDSVNGDDANSGTTESAPFKTISAIPDVATGQYVAFAADSNWRESFSAATGPGARLIVYDSGTPPILDGADVVPAGNFTASLHADAGGVVYETTLSRDPDGVYVSGDTYMMWEDGAWLVRKTSVAACAATAGTFYIPDFNATATPSLAYVHPFGSTDPTSDGKVYEASKRAACVELAAYNNAEVEGIHCRRGMSAYGVVTGGRDTVMRRMLFAQGGKHNIVQKSGVMEDCVAFDAETGRTVLVDGGIIPFTFYEQDPSGREWTLRRCMSILPVGRSCAESVYSHGSTGSPGWHNRGTVDKFISLRSGLVGGVVSESILDDVCVLDAQGAAISMSGKATSINLSRPFIRATSTNSNLIQHPAAGGVAGASVEISHGAVYSPSGAATTNTIFSMALASVVNLHHNIVRLDSRATHYDLAAAQAGSKSKNNIFVQSKTGTTNWGYVGANVESDYNVYINLLVTSVYWQGPSGTAFTLAEWRSESGKDTNSVMLNATQAEQLFLNGAAGMANGDFRIDPACTLTFVDGTPLVGNCGPQEHYNWNTRTVDSGAPFSWPTPPATEAECASYIYAPTAWDFYPA